MAINQNITGFTRPAPNRAEQTVAEFELNAVTQSVELRPLTTEINTWKDQANATQDAINASQAAAATSATQAADARTQSQQYSQVSENAANTSISASIDAENALQSTLNAASEVGALDLEKANKAVKRQNMKFFNLNLL